VRFVTQQRFAASVDEVLALFTDPDFYAGLVGLPKLSTPEVIDHRATPGEVRLRLRQRYIGDLPKAALAVVDPAKLSWVEELVFDLDAARATSVLRPDNYADRFRCSGEYTYRADGPDTTLRRLEGEVKIRMPLVGGKVEGALVSGLREHAAAEQALIATRL
jgi:hypothetical protein